jgi:hypothetical protein
VSYRAKNTINNALSFETDVLISLLVFGMYRSRLDAAQSPSVALEKGLHRLRAPTSRRRANSTSPSPMPRRRSSQPNNMLVVRPLSKRPRLQVLAGLTLIALLAVVSTCVILIRRFVNNMSCNEWYVCLNYAHQGIVGTLPLSDRAIHSLFQPL